MRTVSVARRRTTQPETVADIGEFALIGRRTGGPAPAARPRCSAPATTPPWSPPPTAGWSRPPTCSSRACTSGSTGRRRSTLGRRRSRSTWPTSPRWARCRRRCSSGSPARPPTATAVVEGLARRHVGGGGPRRRRGRRRRHGERGPDRDLRHRARRPGRTTAGDARRRAAGRRARGRGQARLGGRRARRAGPWFPLAGHGRRRVPRAGAAVRGGPAGRTGRGDGDDRRLGRAAGRPRAHRRGVQCGHRRAHRARSRCRSGSSTWRPRSAPTRGTGCSPVARTTRWPRRSPNRPPCPTGWAHDRHRDQGRHGDRRRQAVRGRRRVAALA